MVLQSGPAGSQLPAMEEAPACKKVRLDGDQEGAGLGAGPTEAPPPELSSQLQSLQRALLSQCLCGSPTQELTRPFQALRLLLPPGPSHNSVPSTSQDIPPAAEDRNLLLQLLSCVQLTCETGCRQASRGSICCHLAELCDSLVRDDLSLADTLMSLVVGGGRDLFVCYAAGRALASMLVLARGEAERWLPCLLRAALEEGSGEGLGPALEVVRSVVEWREEGGADEEGGASGSGRCQTVGYTHEGGVGEVKCMYIRALEGSWGALVERFHAIMSAGRWSRMEEPATVSFLGLWEAIISVKANLSVADTKPFYARLESFVPLLSAQLPSVLWKRLLDLFGEVLCYGSTLALQDMLADEPCNLAHLIIRSVKDRRLLDQVPYYSGSTGGFTGSGSCDDDTEATPGDRPLLQKVVLLVLKSVAVTVKETRCESSSDTSSRSSSNSGSDEADMAVIERSIREVLRLTDALVKGLVPFHPDTPLCEWMVRLFSDQDDALVEAMVCTLDTFIGLAARVRCQPELHRSLNPVPTFVRFLGSVSHDPDVLLDLLVSNETCFLLYLLRFLKFVRRYWEEFVGCCGRGLDDTMSVLIRLRIAVDRLVAKSLFPYDISPVLKLLHKCEEMYEVKEN